MTAGSLAAPFGITERKGGGREHRPERTRGRLIDAAVSAFAERGYAATSVHDICGLADLSVGSFYYHFDDKAGITLEILEREHAGVTRGLEVMDLGRASSIEESVSEILNGPQAPLYRALREAAEVERHVADVAAELRRVTQDALASAITRTRQGTDTYRLRPRSIAWSFLAMIRAALADPSDDEEPRARDRGDLPSRRRGPRDTQRDRTCLRHGQEPPLPRAREEWPHQCARSAG